MELANIPSSKSDQINSPQQQRQSLFRWWIVLPIVLVSMTTATTDPIFLNDLMIKRYEIEYGLTNESSPASETACNTEALQNNSQIVELSTQVQKSVSRLNIIMAAAGAVPGVLTYIIL